MMFGTGSNAELTRKYDRVKVQNNIHTSKHINKQTSPVFNCVTPESVSLALLANNILFFYFFSCTDIQQRDIQAGTDKTLL